MTDLFGNPDFEQIEMFPPQREPVRARQSHLDCVGPAIDRYRAEQRMMMIREAGRRLEERKAGLSA